MNVLNVYASCTGNTRKVALQIEATVKDEGHKVTSIEVTEALDITGLNVLDYDFVFIGAGVYAWLPPKSMIRFIEKLNKYHVKNGDIKKCSPRIAGKKAVAYCTYGGPHTGVNEAVIVPKYLAQLFDHLGFEIVAEYHFEADFQSEGFSQYSVGGRMGDITGRPNQNDLKRIHNLVKGILQV